MAALSLLTLRTPLGDPHSVSDTEFCCWVGEALPGEQMTYHRGFLAIDTCPERSPLDSVRQAELVTLARSARLTFEAGLVHLIQRRLGPHRFAYIAIARPKPRARRVELSTLLAQREAA